MAPKSVAITRVGNKRHDTRLSALATTARVRMLARRLEKLEKDAVAARRVARERERRLARMERMMTPLMMARSRP
jgi:DNA-binding HxlR family transcriptional regulator